MAAGFSAARGKTIVSMDGDFQNDPSDIPKLISKLKEGYDVVCGWRKSRKDKLISRRVPSAIANWIIGKITGVPIHDNGCSLKAYRAAVIKNVSLYAEMHRFIPAMATLAGARITEIVVDHHPRRFGKSKYGIGRIWRVILDIAKVKMITGFASRPSLWFGLLSFLFFVFGFSALFIAMGVYLAGFIEGWLVLSTVAFLLLFLGVHLLSLGMIGELFVTTGDYTPVKTLGPAIAEPEVRSWNRQNC
jgi:glycosyltransferase involved in cell wall biosynthesis